MSIWLTAIILPVLGGLRVGSKVNLERSLKLGDEMGPITNQGSVQRITGYIDQAEQAAAHARHLAALMAPPFEVGGQTYALRVELGVALFPADAVSPRGLLTLAEATAFGVL